MRRGIVEHHRIHDSAGWYTHRLQNQCEIKQADWLLRLGHLLVELSICQGDESKVREELSAIELDEVMEGALHRCSARWRASAAA